MSRTYPVATLDGQTSADDIETGLALVRVLHIATIDSGYIDDAAIRAISITLDLAQRYLTAGADWAHEVQAAETTASNARLANKGRKAA